ncbi:UNVERIFIED_ORG: GAF domain-containing protein [Rhodococcus erythropolis]
MPHGQTRTIPMLPLLPPLTNFDDASRSVVSYLDEYLPLALWSITRFDGSNQIFLTVSPNPLHIEVGETRAWPNTMCSEVVLGNAPPVSSNRALVRALSRDGRWEGIGAYVSIPILHNDGSLFGTLCGADPSAGDSALEDNLALLNLLCRLLGTILDVDY